MTSVIPFKQDDEVILHNLVNKQSFNGTRGLIMGPMNSTTTRYPVSIPNTSTTLHVKPTNLQLLSQTHDSSQLSLGSLGVKPFIKKIKITGNTQPHTLKHEYEKVFDQYELLYVALEDEIIKDYNKMFNKLSTHVECSTLKDQLSQLRADNKQLRNYLRDTKKELQLLQSKLNTSPLEKFRPLTSFNKPIPNLNPNLTEQKECSPSVHSENSNFLNSTPQSTPSILSTETRHDLRPTVNQLLNTEPDLPAYEDMHKLQQSWWYVPCFYGWFVPPLPYYGPLYPFPFQTQPNTCCHCGQWRPQNGFVT